MKDLARLKFVSLMKNKNFAVKHFVIFMLPRFKVLNSHEEIMNANFKCKELQGD